MWVGTQLEAKMKEKKDIHEQIMGIQQIMHDHFGKYPDGTWLEQHLLSDQIFMYTGVQPILDIGYCEYCEHYKGVNHERRLIKNISVINSYCTWRLGAVKPNFRCLFFGPKKLYMDVMLLKFENIIKTRNIIELYWWLSRKDKPREEYY